MLRVDIICHGVSSPVIWSRYLNDKFPNEKILKVVFKEKTNGWKKWRVHIKTDSSDYEAERTMDSFMSSYLNGYNVRESCFNCRAKGINSRTSDITIADAWGLPENDVDLNDGFGLSSIIIYSKDALDVFMKLKDDFVFKEYSFDDIVFGNKAYTECIKPNIFRKKFLMKILVTKNVNRFLYCYSSRTILGKIRNKLNKVRNKE